MLDTIAAACTAAVLTYAPGAGHLSFAVYVVTLRAGRTVRVAVTKEVDRTINPKGIFDVTIGASRLSRLDELAVMGAVVKAHAAWFERVHGEGATALYAMPTRRSTADFRDYYEC